jgi:hypothetical protein
MSVTNNRRGSHQPLRPVAYPPLRLVVTSPPPARGPERPRRGPDPGHGPDPRRGPDPARRPDPVPMLLAQAALRAGAATEAWFY